MHTPDDRTFCPRRPRLTIEDWEAVGTDNVVARQMAVARFKLKDLGLKGGVGLRAFYICGPSGVGKTHVIVEQEKLWRSRGIMPLRFRPSNVGELLDYFAQAGGTRPLIMEEADIIFRSKPMFEIMKQATDPLTPDIFNRLMKIEGEKVDVPISLNVPIVMSTNMDLLGSLGWDKDLIADRDALFSRSRPIVISNNAHALWEWSIYLALTSHLTMDVILSNPSGGKPFHQSNPLSIQAKALDWFTDNLNRVDVISPRTLKQISAAMGRAHFGNMPAAILQDELDGLLGEERSTAVPTPAKAVWATLLKEMPKHGVDAKLAA